MIEHFGKGRWIKTLFLIIMAAVWALPVIDAVAESLKGKGVLNYFAVLTFPKVNYFRVVANSLIISAAAAAIVAAIATLGAYAFSKMEFRPKDPIYYSILACLAIPPAAVMTPLFFSMKTLHLMNSYFSLILPQVAFNAPLMLLILKNYFDTIPSSILEAARIDGASRLRIYARFILPLGTPAMVNIVILTFIYSWNDFLIPLLFVRRESMYTVTLATSFFTSTKNQTPEMVAQLYAALILMTIPSVCIYLFGQRYLKDGLTAGAVKQ